MNMYLSLKWPQNTVKLLAGIFWPFKDTILSGDREQIEKEKYQKQVNKFYLQEIFLDFSPEVILSTKMADIKIRDTRTNTLKNSSLKKNRLSQV